jgi:hypothetical protein
LEGARGPSTITLTAVVPTAGGWREVEEVVTALLPSVAEVGLEIVIACCAQGAPRPPEFEGVVTIEVHERDLFLARVAAVQRATGEIVALLEDHAVPDADWARSVIAAWETHPEATAMVHSIVVNPAAKIWELTLFTITFGPFLAVDRLTPDRLPVPGTVSFRRSLVPPVLVPGWLEYEMLPDLIASGSVALDCSTAPVHVQPITWRAPWLSFHSGRMFAGSMARDRSLTRSSQFRRVWRDTSTVVEQTLAARRRTNAGLVGRRFVVCMTALLTAHVCGQIVGVASRSIGRSASALQ